MSQYLNSLIASIKNNHVLVQWSFHNVFLGDEDLKHYPLNQPSCLWEKTLPKRFFSTSPWLKGENGGGGRKNRNVPGWETRMGSCHAPWRLQSMTGKGKTPLSGQKSSQFNAVDSLFTKALPASFPPHKSILLSLPCGDLNMAHHDCRSQIAILCRLWVSTFAAEISGRLFVLGQHQLHKQYWERVQ